MPDFEGVRVDGKLFIIERALAGFCGSCREVASGWRQLLCCTRSTSNSSSPRNDIGGDSFCRKTIGQEDCDWRNRAKARLNLSRK
jgi:hypothetical protein